MVRAQQNEGSRVRYLLAAIARWLLSASLIYAPWAYGGVRPWTLEILDVLLVATCGCWLIDCARQRRWPCVPRPAWIIAAGALMQGWLMTLNAHSYFDADLGALVPIASPAPHLPGSCDGPASWRSMLAFSGMLGAFLFCCELARDSIWRKRIWAVLALTGASIAAFGIAQKIGGDAVLACVWEPAKRDVTNNFAMFRYRGNAGAYLNLVLPLTAAFTFLSFQRRERPSSRAVWSSALFLVVLGIQLNPSRGSGLIASFLGLAMSASVLIFYRHHSRRWLLAAPLIPMLVVVIALAGLGGWETGWERLEILGANPVDRSPVEIYVQMVPDAGAFGFGPGSFAAAFPAYQQAHDFQGRAFPAFWRDAHFTHAHNDYFETLIEWGWCGALLAVVLILGGLRRGLWRCIDPATRFSQRWLLGASLLALGGILFQALIDFPLQIPALQLDFAVLLGLNWGSASNVPESDSSPKKRRDLSAAKSSLTFSTISIS